MWTDKDIQTGWKFPNVIDGWVGAWAAATIGKR